MYHYIIRCVIRVHTYRYVYKCMYREGTRNTGRFLFPPPRHRYRTQKLGKTCSLFIHSPSTNIIHTEVISINKRRVGDSGSQPAAYNGARWHETRTGNECIHRPRTIHVRFSLRHSVFGFCLFGSFVKYTFYIRRIELCVFHCRLARVFP